MEGEMQSDSAIVPQIELSSAVSKRSLASGSGSLFGTGPSVGRNWSTCDVKTPTGVKCCAQNFPHCFRNLSVASDNSYDEVSTCKGETFIPSTTRNKPRHDETTYYPYISVRSDYEPPDYLNTSYYPEHKDMTIFERRLQSFKRWPGKWSMRPEDLAECGFFYSNSGDRVICFMCNLSIRYFEDADTAMGEHKWHSPLCKFVMSTYNFRKW